MLGSYEGQQLCSFTNFMLLELISPFFFNFTPQQTQTRLLHCSWVRGLGLCDMTFLQFIHYQPNYVYNLYMRIVLRNLSQCISFTCLMKYYSYRAHTENQFFRRQHFVIIQFIFIVAAYSALALHITDGWSSMRHLKQE